MWEYKDVYLNWGPSGFDENDNLVMADSLVDQLNKLGRYGWELIQIRCTAIGATSGTATFKRELTVRRLEELQQLDSRSDQ